VEALFGVLILIVFCTLISFWEKTRFDTFITPFGVLAWPYTLVVTMINLGGVHFGYFPVSLKCILFIILCLVFFLLGGYTVLAFFRGRVDELFIDKKTHSNIGYFFDLYRPLFVFLAIISVLSGFVQLRLLISEYGWLEVGTRNFKIAYGSGPLGHLMMLSRPAFIFLFAAYLNSRKSYLLIILISLFIVVLFRQVKYHVIVIFLGGLYLSYYYRIFRFSLKMALIYILIIYFLFNISYVVGFSTLGIGHAYSSKVQAFLFNHFFTYLFGGPIGFSEILNDISYPIGGVREIFSVPINMYKVLTGDEQLVTIVHKKWISISTIYQYFHSSNTFGLFGMTYMYLGKLGSLIYVFFIGVMAYLFMSLSVLYRRSLGIQLVYVFILGFLTLSFFGLYFNMLTFVEISFYMLVIPRMFLMTRQLLKTSLSQLRREVSVNDQG